MACSAPSSAPRVFAASFAILSFGTGLSLTVLAVYLVRHLHVRPAAYGLGMSVAALGGMVSGPLAGRLADRTDGRRTYAGLVGVMAVATASIAVADKWVALALLSVLVIGGRGSAAVMGGLIGRELSPERRVRYRALVKTAGNATMLAGFGLGGVVLAVDATPIFRLSFLVEAATLGAAGVLVLTTSRPADVRADAPVTRRGVARDRRFLMLTLLNAVILLYSSVLTVALPLWIAAEAHSLLWLISVAAAINTGAVLVLQVPVARGITGVATAARAGRRGATLIGFGIALFPVAGAVPGNLLKALVIVAQALLVAVGEVLYAAGSWELVYRLSPPESLAEYQGLFNLGLDVSLLVAPALFGWLASAKHTAGWLAVAAAFIACALLLRRADLTP